MNNGKVRAIVSDVLHALESNAHGKSQFLVACVGAVATLVLWWVHLSHPPVFGDAFLRGRISPMWLLIALAPPFIMTFGLANMLLLKPPSDTPTTGPMSGYLYQQESDKKWKIAVTSGIASAANLLLMFVTAGPA